MNRTRTAALVAALVLGSAGAAAATEQPATERHVYLYPLLDPAGAPGWANSGVQVKVAALPSCTDVPSGGQIDDVVAGTPAPEVIAPPKQGFPAGTVIKAVHVSIPLCEQPEPTPSPEPTEPAPSPEPTPEPAPTPAATAPSPTPAPERVLVERCAKDWMFVDGLGCVVAPGTEPEQEWG